MTAGTTWAPAPVKVSPPQAPSAELVDAVEAIFAEQRVGVRFEDGFKVYVYTAPASVHVGSLVLVPANKFRPQPSIATVVTLTPPPYRGPVKAVIEVLS